MRLKKAFPLTGLLLVAIFLLPPGLFAGIPTFISVTTDDNDGDGHIDRVDILFSENVDISDPNGALDGLDCITVTGYTIADGDYTAADTGSVTLLLIQGGGYDTDAKPDVSYSQGQTCDIKSVSTSEEIADSYTFNTTADGAKPVIINSKTYDSNDDGHIDRIEYELSESIVDVPGTDNFDIAGYGGESFSTTVTGISGGVDDNDADDNRFSIAFTQGGGYDTGNTPGFDYTSDGTDDVEDAAGNKLNTVAGGTTSDGANPVLVAAGTTRWNISGIDWWNRVNLTYSEPVLCGDLALGSGPAASDATAGNFNPASEHGGDYASGVLRGYGSFATGGNVAVPNGEVGVTVEAGGVVRFDLARSDDGHGSISSGNTAPSGDFTPIANTGIRDEAGNSLVSTTDVATTAGTVWDLDKPVITKAATYDSNRDGSIDRVEFETNDANSVGIQDGFNAANFDVAGFNGEGFATGVRGISGGVADVDANDNRFSITFTQAGPWDTDLTPGYSYSGSDIYLVDLAGNRLDNTGGTASDGALPAFRSIRTGDTDENGYIDRLQLMFSENVDINDAGGAGDGLNCIGVAGYTIENGNYGATDVNSITLNLNEGASYDTGAKPVTLYTTSGSSTIRDRAVTPNEMFNGETTGTSDGARPIMIVADFFDPDMNDIDAGDHIQVGFTEAMRLACTTVTDFELLNTAFGDSFGGGSYLDDDIPSDTYINIVLGTSPSLVLPDIWSVPGPGNPSGLGIKAGGTSCVEDLASNKSPQGVELDIGGSGSNAIMTVTATDGSGVFTNPYTQSVFMDADITVQIKTQYNANFVAVWFDVGAVPDGLSTTNPNDRRIVATGSGYEWTAIIPHDDPEMVNGSKVQFIVDTDGAHYYYDGPEASGGSLPWEFTVIYEQPRRVTIRNNIINPHRGDQTYINYYLNSSTTVKITIYDLAGDPVRILFNSAGSAGTNLVTWDGKNRRGAAVVPGVYYIVIKISQERFVRKVLVVR